MTGKLFTFEGIEGAGKGSIVAKLKETLAEEGHPISRIPVYEPGGTPFGALARACLKKNIDKERQEYIKPIMDKIALFDLSPLSQSFLFFASREDQYRKVVKGELDRGKHVFLDRSIDSTTCYQGWGQDEELVDWIRMTNQRILDSMGLAITQTYWMDGPLDMLLGRALARDDGKKDYFDSKGPEFFEKVQRGYGTEMHLANGRILRVCNFDGQFDKAFEEVYQSVSERL